MRPVTAFFAQTVPGRIIGAWLVVRPDLPLLHKDDKALANRMSYLAARIGTLDHKSRPDSWVIGETLSVYRSLQARRIATPAEIFRIPITFMA